MAKVRYAFADDYYRMYGKMPMTVSFIVTHDCNLRCTYCYETHKDNGRMTVEIGKRCVDALFAADASNNEYLNKDTADGIILDFIGGETLLEIDLIDQIVDYFRLKAYQLGHRWVTQYMVNIGTNGVLYFEPSVQRFIRKNKGRVSIGVTVDGDKETHDSCRLDCAGCGSFDRANAAFKDVIKTFGRGNTKFTISPDNVGRVFIACKDLIENNYIDQLQCNCVFEEGWNEDLAGVLYRELKKLADWMLADPDRYDETNLAILNPDMGDSADKYDDINWCGGSGKMLAFDIDGTMLPCMRYAPMSVPDQPVYAIGDLEHGLMGTDEYRQRVAELKAVTRTSQCDEECLSCPISHGCAWCSAYNYQVFGTPNKRTKYTCTTHKATTMVNAYYHNKAYCLGYDERPYRLSIPDEWALAIIDETEYQMLRDLELQAFRQYADKLAQ